METEPSWIRVSGQGKCLGFSRSNVEFTISRVKFHPQFSACSTLNACLGSLWESLQLWVVLGLIWWHLGFPGLAARSG